MGTRKGGARVFPQLQKLVETRVLLEGHCPTDFCSIPAKKRQVIYGTDGKGSNGRGKKWLPWKFWRIWFNEQLERKGGLPEGEGFLASHQEQ